MKKKEPSEKELTERYLKLKWIAAQTCWPILEQNQDLGSKIKELGSPHNFPIHIERARVINDTDDVFYEYQLLMGSGLSTLARIHRFSISIATINKSSELCIDLQGFENRKFVFPLSVKFLDTLELFTNKETALIELTKISQYRSALCDLTEIKEEAFIAI